MFITPQDGPEETEDECLKLYNEYQQPPKPLPAKRKVTYLMNVTDVPPTRHGM